MRYSISSFRILVGVVLAVCVLAGKALALAPDEIALIVNSNEPKGRELADFYAQQRHIPDNRILELSLPTSEEISFEQYEEVVVPQVREFLKTGNLVDQVKCFVTFYGMPLRITNRQQTAEEGREQTALRGQLLQAAAHMQPAVQKIEVLAERLNPNFVPKGGGDFDSMRQRTETAAREVSEQARTIPDGRRRVEILAEMYDDMTPLLGDAAAINHLAITEALKDTAENPGTTKPAESQALQTMKDEYQKAVKAAAELEQNRYDPRARDDLRRLVFSHFGLFAFAHLMKDHVDYLESKDSGSALDSELALVRWPAYQRTKWIDNPLFYQATRRPNVITYMVMRLDAPKPEQVKDIITNSIKVENEGLKGKVVLDSRGIALGHEAPDTVGMSGYDQSLRDLGTLVRQHTKLELLADDNPDPLPAHSAENVALYCGWYSVRHYIPECKFVPGAIGFHIASYELITLHSAGETGWVAGLLNDGVAATLGSVAEPYVQAFPMPSEFFPLLMTGRMTLAEAYWKTTRTVSWMMDAIGDPLYTPYKANPAIVVDDLPEKLREAFVEQGSHP